MYLLGSFKSLLLFDSRFYLFLIFFMHTIYMFLGRLEYRESLLYLENEVFFNFVVDSPTSVFLSIMLLAFLMSSTIIRLRKLRGTK